MARPAALSFTPWLAHVRPTGPLRLPLCMLSSQLPVRLPVAAQGGNRNGVRASDCYTHCVTVLGAPYSWPTHRNHRRRTLRLFVARPWNGARRPVRRRSARPKAMLEAAAYFALACLTVAGAAVACYAGVEGAGRVLDWWLDRQAWRSAKDENPEESAEWEAGKPRGGWPTGPAPGAKP